MAEAEGFSAAASRYRAAGWQGVLPLNGKVLAVKGLTGRDGRWPTPDELTEWGTKFKDANIGLRLPKNLIGIDVDAYGDKQGGETLELWESRCGALPPTFRSSARDDTVSGIRFYKVPTDVPIPSELGPGVEIVQFHHRYSVVWPSKHPELGTTYHWYNTFGIVTTEIPGPWELAELPDSWSEQFRGMAEGSAAAVVPEDSEGGRLSGSLLSALLAAPPPGRGSRNNWLTRVCGHIAKVGLHEDGYEQLMLTVNRSLAEPLDVEEVLKTARSIWSAEQRNGLVPGAKPSSENGYLLSAENKLLIGVKEKDGGSIHLEPCSDFDIRVIGKYTDDRFNTHYKVKIVSELHGTPRFMTEPAAMFGDGKALRRRLQSMECNIWPIPGDIGTSENPQPINRLGHYISTQPTTTLEVVPCMGWHDTAGGFVCDEGVITPTEVQADTAWVLDPMVRTRDPMQNKYGFEGSLEQAQKILREVLTFQDETVTSVFGAWWAACFMKAQLMKKVAGFPFMAIEATSGTGKTEGFFNLMVQLNGATRLGSHQTAAAFRDSMASNRSGIIWIDDLDNATNTYQDIRCATNEASRSKKAADNTATASVRLVAPVLLTGESLPGLADQKALLDRLIQLDVPPARNRRSLHSDREQWLDIVELREAHPELWSYAGWYVQQALTHVDDLLQEWNSLRPEGQSRHADKMTVLRIGARMLDILCGNENAEHARRVDEWTGQQKAPVGDYLVNRILPEALRTGMVPQSAMGWPAVFVDGDNIVWWHAGRLSDWWSKEQRGLSERERGFGSLSSLENHRAAMGITGSDRRKFRINRQGERFSQQNYYRCPPALSAHILEVAGITASDLAESLSEQD